MRAVVYVRPRGGVLDPQGQAVVSALKHLDFPEVLDARQGKIIELVLEDGDATKAKERVTQMCEQLLANTVIEDYQVKIEA